MQEVTTILVERRRHKTQSLQKESEDFLLDFNKMTPFNKLQENSQFVLVPKGEAIIHRVENSIRNTQKEILSITPWREFSQWMFTFPELWRQTVERGVKIRWLTEKNPQNLDLASEQANILLDYPNFVLKTMPEKPEKRVGIYDGKEMFIAITQNMNAGESEALWTNNPTMIHILQDYFEMKWQQATEKRK